MLFPREKVFWDLLRMARTVHKALSDHTGPTKYLVEKAFLAGYRKRIYEEQKWQKYAGQWHP